MSKQSRELDADSALAEHCVHSEIIFTYLCNAVEKTLSVAHRVLIHQLIFLKECTDSLYACQLLNASRWPCLSDESLSYVLAASASAADTGFIPVYLCSDWHTCVISGLKIGERAAL